MGKKKSKKFDIISIVIFAVLVVALAMTIVGICIAWTKSVSATDLGGGSSSQSTNTLTAWLNSQSEKTANGGEPISGLNVNVAFAIMTVIFTGLTAIAFCANKFSGIKALKFVLLGCGLLALACGVVTIITGYTFTNGLANGGLSWGGVNFGSVKSSPAAGLWLLSISGIVGGAAGAVGALKK